MKSGGTPPTQCSNTTNIGNILDFSYNFSVDTADNGNVVSITNNRDTNRMQNFTYDSMNRIATAYTSGNLWGETFQIDQWGNLNKILPYSGKPQPENLNQMAGNNNRFTGMSYDAAGNLLNDGASTYLYDAENRIQTGAGVTYTYDGDGKRVQKSNGKLYWYGMGSDVLDESDASGNITDEYIFFGGKRIARRNVSSGNIFYYFADHLGTSRVILQAGQTTACYDADFYPFGGERIVTNTCPQNYKFTSKERDFESGLDNFGARYLGSSMGRFVSPDGFTYAIKADPQTWNLYSYIRNSPLNKTDPDGHDWFLIKGNWKWQKGHKFIDPNSHKVLSTHGYRYLLEFQKTGTNKLGASVGTLTLHDQDKVVAQSLGFSGGNGFTIIPNGNFMIRLDIRGTAQDSSSLRFDQSANTNVMRQFYGIQQIAPIIQGPNGEAMDGRYEWGSLRAALNPFPGQKGEAFQGNYLHGKNRQGDYTHGCICERSEAVLHFLLNNIDPAQNSHVPVSVEGPGNQ